MSSAVRTTKRAAVEAKIINKDSNVAKIRQGTEIEVIFDEIGFEGSLFPAIFVENKGSCLALVEFQTIKENRGRKLLREVIKHTQIRPKPRKIEMIGKFGKGDDVEATYRGGWWKGTISRVLPDSKYKVFFPKTGDSLKRSHSELRVHQPWSGYLSITCCKSGSGEVKEELQDGKKGMKVKTMAGSQSYGAKETIARTTKDKCLEDKTKGNVKIIAKGSGSKSVTPNNHLFEVTVRASKKMKTTSDIHPNSDSSKAIYIAKTFAICCQKCQTFEEETAIWNERKDSLNKRARVLEKRMKDLKEEMDEYKNLRPGSLRMLLLYN